MTVMNSIIKTLVLCLYNIPYGRKYWRRIKFGGLAAGEATIKFKSVKFKYNLCE